MSSDPWADLAMTLDEATDAIGRTAEASSPARPVHKMGVALGRWDGWRVKRHLQRSSRHKVRAQRIILRSVGR